MSHYYDVEEMHRDGWFVLPKVFACRLDADALLLDAVKLQDGAVMGLGVTRDSRGFFRNWIGDLGGVPSMAPHVESWRTTLESLAR